MKISIVVPVLNEAERIDACLDHALAQGTATGPIVEVIVVDGGSTDGTVARAKAREEELGPGRIRVIAATRRGRARQLNAGAREAKGDVVVFLHVDTEPPPDAVTRIARAVGDGADYGWFTVRIASRDPRLRVASRIWSMRSKLFVSSTGDQAQFFRRDFFFRAGAYPPFDLCEDLAILRHARRIGKHRCIDAPVTTSARRWEANGVGRTVATMWKLRLKYHLGVRPEQLAKEWRALTRG